MVNDIDIAKQEGEISARIEEIKQRLGDSLLILGHHYQRSQIIDLSDCIGDSFALAAKAAATQSARYIVFCGVAFMADSAEILRGSGQAVYHPNSTAGCPMADMADIENVEIAFDRISRHAKGRVIPVVYMNSAAEVKAFCGRHGGLVCTSSNADGALKWAYEQGEVVLFMPDEHLATNTADNLGIPQDARTIYDPVEDDGGENFRVGPETELVQWRGHCHVHTHFTPEHIDRARKADPDCLVVVHPECAREVVALADVTGSTTKIVKTVDEAADGRTVVIGTEINLVERLAKIHVGRKRVLPLDRSLCPNMFRISLSNLCQSLEDLDSDTFRVHVASDIVLDARTALERMLSICKSKKPGI